MKWFSFFLFFFFFLPSFVQASVVDLEMHPEDITFSKEEPFIVGEQIRIYAKVRNVGDVDVAGYVSFFQGTIPIGDSQVISVRANGSPEEVYVDFVIPKGTFNIRAEIKGTHPKDENTENDLGLKGIFTPIVDDDLDTVENEMDNCVSIFNTDQKDTDGDGYGDTCDEDDDQDGLSDQEEQTLGTDTLLVDTDKDGMSDKQEKEAKANPPESKQEIKVDTTSNKEEPYIATESTSATTEEVFPVESELQPTDQEKTITNNFYEKEEPDTFSISPNALFNYQRIQWRTYVFKAHIPSESGYRVEWDFGDGVTSNRTSVEHTYRGFGDFIVRMRVIDPEKRVSSDQTTVTVSFFVFENPAIKLLSLFFVTLFLTGLAFLFRSGRVKEQKIKFKAKERKLSVQEHVQEDKEESISFSIEEKD